MRIKKRIDLIENEIKESEEPAEDEEEVKQAEDFTMKEQMNSQVKDIVRKSTIKNNNQKSNNLQDEEDAQKPHFSEQQYLKRETIAED